MSRKLVLVMGLFVLIALLGVALKAERVKAGGSIYIRDDGSVEPEGAPIYSVDNVTYILTDDIVYPTYVGIRVNRSNIVIAGNGYRLQGRGRGALAEGSGFNLIDVGNVTIRNTNVVGFHCGVHFVGSSNNNASDNNIDNNNYGFTLDSSSNNTICGNNITNNWREGIRLAAADNNTICGNNITNNLDYGIWLGFSSDNLICHNNFVDNDQHVYIQTSGYVNFWDDGYPSGGNYWSDFEERYPDTEDVYSGPNQDEPESDGFWDRPYEIYENNQDNYPIIPEFPSFIIMPLFMVATLLAVVVYRRKHSYIASEKRSLKT